MLGKLHEATLVAIALCAGAGCAHETAADRQLSKLQEELARVVADHDGMDRRVTALEVARADARSPDTTGAAAVDPPVVRGRPDEPSGSDDPEDAASRPAIKLTGSPGASGRGRGRREELVELSGPSESAAGSRPSALDPDARRAYDAALEKARGGRHREGLEAFNAFLVRWPDHPYVDNAMYWRAECLSGLGEPAKAIAELEGLVSRFPLGRKVPDALYKLGLLYEKSGDAAKARAALERLERDFPKSDAAKRRARPRNPESQKPTRPKDIQ